MDGTAKIEGAPKSPPRASAAPPTTLDELSQRFEQLMDEALIAAEDCGIRWRSPEGLLVKTLLSGIHMVNDVAYRAERSFAASADSARAVAEAELNKVRAVALAAETAKQQVRAAIELSKVEQAATLRQVVHDSMPGLMAEIRQAVVIREQSWNRDRARANVRAAGTWILGVFLAGFGLSLWLQWADSSLGAHCKSNMVSIDGRTVCYLSGPTFGQAGSQAKP